MTREALTLALEALIETTALCINYEAVEEKTGHEFREAKAVITMGNTAIVTLQAALAEQPEPVAWRCTHNGNVSFTRDTQMALVGWPLLGAHVEPLYAAPPALPGHVVPMGEGEILALLNTAGWPPSLVQPVIIAKLKDVVRAIEAHHGIKT